MISFGREVDLWHVKEPQAEIRASEQNLSGFFTLTVEIDANQLRCACHAAGPGSIFGRDKFPG